MRKIVLAFICICVPFFYNTPGLPAVPPLPATEAADASALYAQLKLEGSLSYEAFRTALEGYEHIKDKKKELLTIIDFSRPSTQQRLFIIDMRLHKLLLSSVVAHGRNSGGNYATSFSNVEGSYKSSLGFYLTDDTYKGKNGYSLRLNGLEKGFNDKARNRAIVMHGAKYANPVGAGAARLGRSLGCPAVPTALARPIINMIKGGSVLYIYADSPTYLSQSQLLHGSELPEADPTA